MELLGCGHGFTELSFLIALREVCRKSKWKFKMAFAIRRPTPPLNGTNFQTFFTPLFFFCNWILHIWNGFYTWSHSKICSSNAQFEYLHLESVKRRPLSWYLVWFLPCSTRWDILFCSHSPSVAVTCILNSCISSRLQYYQLLSRRDRFLALNICPVVVNTTSKCFAIRRKRFCKPCQFCFSTW